MSVVDVEVPLLTARCYTLDLEYRCTQLVGLTKARPVGVARQQRLKRELGLEDLPELTILYNQVTGDEERDFTGRLASRHEVSQGLILADVPNDDSAFFRGVCVLLAIDDTYWVHLREMVRGYLESSQDLAAAIQAKLRLPIEAYEREVEHFLATGDIEDIVITATAYLLLLRFVLL